jgi:quercetin dioxygenase-like cupin family protein
MHGRASANQSVTDNLKILIMTSLLTTLDPVTTSLIAKTILAKEGYTCSLLTLAPGDETPRRDANQIAEHLLFVIEGEATIRFGKMNTILAKDQALLVRKDEEHVIVAHPGGWAKILRVEVPPRQIVTPQIITFER